MGLFVLLLAAFVVSHIALASPPLRDGFVARLGENRFRIGYSILSLALLFGAVQAYKGTADTLVWQVGTGAYHAANLIMLIASILFVGSLTPRNRALAGVPAVHVWLSGNLPTIILAAGIGTLALVGAAFQDGKKARQLGSDWKLYTARTSFVPFAAIVTGKQPLAALWPGLVPVVGGLLFWLLMTFLHPSLMKAPTVGIWEFV
jgi:uncharacterized membrane protein